MSFPSALDNGTTLPNPQATDKQNSPDHASLHTATNSAVIAVETKVGTGSSTPASNTLLFGTGAGTSAWQTLTSAQLAATLSDETGTGSVVFANTPTLITPKVDTINENTLNNGVTVGGVNLKSGVIPSSAILNLVNTAALQASAVTAAKLAFGVVYRRQGGTTGDATWQTAGTSNTDTSAKAVFIQTGVGNIAAAETTVTFPVAFNQIPIVLGAPQTATSQNTSFRVRAVTATNFIASLIQNGTASTQATSENFAWIAIGQ